jgi:hypothetical protein
MFSLTVAQPGRNVWVEWNLDISAWFVLLLLAFTMYYANYIRLLVLWIEIWNPPKVKLKNRSWNKGNNKNLCGYQICNKSKTKLKVLNQSIMF